MDKNLFELPRQTFELMREKVGASPVETEFSFDDSEVRIATDDFSITSKEGKLCFASGNVRGLFYAVYEYFERYCSCRYFWDGDIIPEMKTLPAENIRFVKHFRYTYRGLRYFAHRSLYRFQAEHWSFEDWQKEIDFLLKKHFSLFMLRTGQDDLFQKTYPDEVPYPPEDGISPDAQERSYNDRTELISLKYKGQLRKKILDYAFERGLMHPEDMGPMTHWYSPTPRAYLEHFKPDFLVQSSDNYQGEIMQVWDCRKDENIERYLELTWSHIEHYGKPELFHIIGLAERVFGNPEENFALKCQVMRKFIRKLREKYPHAPLLIASWDFMFRWKAPEVRKFLQELDSANTVILDYTIDSDSRMNNFKNWDLPRRFPWIFGIFQAYEPQCDLFLDLDRIEEMYIPVKDDPQCKGMVVWSENSHSNPLLLEYLAKKSADEAFSLEKFCLDRCGKWADGMLELWKLSRSAFACNAWVYGTERMYQGICSNHFNLLKYFANIKDKDQAGLYAECAYKYPKLDIPDAFFEKAAALVSDDMSDLVMRDLTDLVRSALMCRITQEQCKISMQITNRHPEKADGTHLLNLIRLMGDLLETLPEFSMFATLEKMKQQGKLNSHAELTLKGNGENSYCRSYIFEFYRGLYEAEALCVKNELDKLAAGEYPDKEALLKEFNKIQDAFYLTPLATFQRADKKTPVELIRALPQMLKEC